MRVCCGNGGGRIGRKFQVKYCWLGADGPAMMAATAPLNVTDTAERQSRMASVE